VSTPDRPDLGGDFLTPLPVLGARRAADLARRADASPYADDELRDAEARLAALEQLWPRRRRHQVEWTGPGRDVVRLVALSRGVVVSLSAVLFDVDRATLKPGAREKLAKVAGLLLAYPGDYHLQVEGHTDAVGRPEYNLRLSQDRADSVAGYLRASGLSGERIVSVQGFGEDRPVAGNDTPEGRQ